MSIAAAHVESVAGQPRERDGRFAGVPRTPQEGELAEEVAGSFAFPPLRFDTAEQYLAFFQDAPVSDRILSNANYAYRQWRAGTFAAMVDHAIQAHQADPSVARMFQKHRDKWQADLAATRAQAEAAANENLPGRGIDESRLRDVLRAHQMCWHRANVQEDGGEQKVVDYVLPGDHETVDHLSARFHTGEWAPKAMTDSDLPAVDAARQAADASEQAAAASQQVAAAIAAMTDRLSGQLGQIAASAEHTDKNMYVAAQNLSKMR